MAHSLSRFGPRFRLWAALAAGAALIAAGAESAELLRARARAELERSRGEAPVADLLAAANALWPDPIGEADLRVRALAVARSLAPAAAAAEAQAACASAPRRGAVHLLAAMLAGEAKEPANALRELARASASAPFDGALQAAIARELVLAAVESGTSAPLDAAAGSFRAAVAVGELAARDAYVALSAAQAAAPLLALVAGRDPERLEALVEHQARALEREAALAAAATLDAARCDPARRGLALAHRRLGAAAMAAGDPMQAARDLECAAALSPEPDALALDRADALLQSGATSDGVAQLVRALECGRADAARAAGSIRCARAPEAAHAALFELAQKSPDGALRAGVAAIFAELGDATRRLALLAARGASRG